MLCASRSRSSAAFREDEEDDLCSEDRDTRNRNNERRERKLYLQRKNSEESMDTVELVETATTWGQEYVPGSLSYDPRLDAVGQTADEILMQMIEIQEGMIKGRKEASTDRNALDRVEETTGRPQGSQSSKSADFNKKNRLSPVSKFKDPRNNRNNLSPKIRSKRDPVNLPGKPDYQIQSLDPTEMSSPRPVDWRCDLPKRFMKSRQVKGDTRTGAGVESYSVEPSTVSRVNVPATTPVQYPGAEMSLSWDRFKDSLKEFGESVLAPCAKANPQLSITNHLWDQFVICLVVRSQLIGPVLQF